jgi:hypothetical protein
VTDLSMGGTIGRDHFLIKPENNDLRSVCRCREGVAPALQGNQERGKRRNSDRMGLTNASTRFLNHARLAIGRTEYALKDAGAAGRGESGMVRIGCQ